MYCGQVLCLEASRPAVTTLALRIGCLRWCGFVETRREHGSVIYRIADPRVSELVTLAETLLEDNAEHVACCTTIDGSGPRSRIGYVPG